MSHVVIFLMSIFFSSFGLGVDGGGSNSDPANTAAGKRQAAAAKLEASGASRMEKTTTEIGIENLMREFKENEIRMADRMKECSANNIPYEAAKICVERLVEESKRNSEKLMKDFNSISAYANNQIAQMCNDWDADTHPSGWDYSGSPWDKILSEPRGVIATLDQCKAVRQEELRRLNLRVGKANSCQSAYTRANVICSPGKFAADIQGMLTQVQAAHANGNMRNMCAGAEKLNKILGSVNAGISSGCFATRMGCMRACSPESKTPNSSLQEKCDKFMDTVVGAAQQSAMNFLTGAMAGKCKDDLTAQEKDPKFACYREGAENNKDCPGAYCAMAGRFPERKTEETCKSFYPVYCDSPQEQQLLSCVCYKNPRDSRCNPADITAQVRQNPWGNFQNNPNIPGLGGGNGGAGGGIGDIGDGDGVGEGLDLPAPGEELAPGQRQENKTAYGGGQGGGGGGFTGGAQGFGLEGGQGGGGAGGSGLNTDVITGTVPGGGGGDASMAGGGGGDGDGSMGGSGGGGRGGDDDKIGKFSLKDFLPGGAQDPSRNPASADSLLLQNGITGAEGLSNFEKVTRKMNQKRSSLVP